MYAGGFKQVLYKEYICWIQVKIHISDQTSLRICNSARITSLTIVRIFLVVVLWLYCCQCHLLVALVSWLIS